MSKIHYVVIHLPLIGKKEENPISINKTPSKLDNLAVKVDKNRNCIVIIFERWNTTLHPPRPEENGKVSFVSNGVVIIGCSDSLEEIQKWAQEVVEDTERIDRGTLSPLPEKAIAW